MAVFVVAGIWQIERGQAKERMLTQRATARQAVAQPLQPFLRRHPSGDTNRLYGQYFSVTGHYDGTHQILLDNQVHDGRVGFRVWTPLVTATGERVLIDRGWVPMPPGGRDDVSMPPAPDGGVTVSGIVRALPRPGVRLGDPPSCQATFWPRVLNYPTIETVRCLYPGTVLNALLLLDADAAHGFVRDWQVDVGMSPLRHYAYALQWFAMALAVAGVFLVVNMKRSR